jgi:hypothetical protein
MNKISKSFILVFALALISLPPLHAHPLIFNAQAASQAPTAQAPDDMTNKITALVSAGKYAEAQRLTTGLLVVYPDDQRLIKAKALIEKWLASPALAVPAPGSSQSTNNASQAEVSSNAEQLTGMDKVDYSALIELAREAQQTTDLSQQDILLRKFMEDSGKFLQKHPNEMLLWQLRAASAISLNAPKEGYQAGQKLLSAGAAESSDSSLQRLLGQLKNKGWLDKQEAERLQVVAENERQQAWSRAEAVRIKAEDIKYTFPARHMHLASWGYGHLTISENDLVYDGSDGHIQLSKGEIREITANGGWGGLKFILKDRKVFVFVIITEDAVTNQHYEQWLSPTGVGNAVVARWRFVLADNNKALKPPTP